MATFRITNQYSREEIWDLIKGKGSQSVCGQGLLQRKVQPYNAAGPLPVSSGALQEGAEDADTDKKQRSFQLA